MYVCPTHSKESLSAYDAVGAAADSFCLFAKPIPGLSPDALCGRSRQLLEAHHQTSPQIADGDRSV